MSGSCKIVLQSSKLTLQSCSVVPGQAFSPKLSLLSSSVVPGQAFSPPDPFHLSKQSKKGNKKIARHYLDLIFLVNKQ